MSLDLKESQLRVHRMQLTKDEDNATGHHAISVVAQVERAQAVARRRMERMGMHLTLEHFRMEVRSLDSDVSAVPLDNAADLVEDSAVVPTGAVDDSEEHPDVTVKFQKATTPLESPRESVELGMEENAHPAVEDSDDSEGPHVEADQEDLVAQDHLAVVIIPTLKTNKS